MAMAVQARQDTTLREEYLLKLWDNYISENLVEFTPCQAAIFDVKTRKQIVGSPGFYVQNTELAHILESMKYPEVAYRNGVTVNRKHYNVKLADGRHGIYARDGLDGCTVCKSFAFVVVAVHDREANAEECNEAIMKLGDYFMKLGL